MSLFTPGVNHFFEKVLTPRRTSSWPATCFQMAKGVYAPFHHKSQLVLGRKLHIIYVVFLKHTDATTSSQLVSVFLRSRGYTTLASCSILTPSIATKGFFTEPNNWLP